MTQRNLEELINELNERLIATSLVQQFIVSFIAGLSSANTKILRDAVDNLLTYYVDRKQGSKTLQKELREYIEIIDGAPLKDPRAGFQVIKGSREDEAQ
jgi:hypothetical protein